MTGPHPPRVLVVMAHEPRRAPLLATLEELDADVSVGMWEEPRAPAHGIDLLVFDTPPGRPVVPAVDAWLEVVRPRPAVLLLVELRRAAVVERLGATLDDFAFKPLASEEARLRIGRLLRAQRSGRPVRGTIEAGDLRISVESRLVFAGGRRVVLPRRQFDLLVYLATHAGRVLSRAQLLEAVWSEPAEVPTRTVDMHIARLRAALGTHARCIATVHGVGYRFDVTTGQ